MLCDSASEVSGPVAMMTGDHSGPGTPCTSSREMRMRGCDCTASVTVCGKHVTIDGERGAGGHARRVGRAHHDRAEPPHLFLDQADGVVDLVGAERIAADELGEAVGLVHGRRAHRAHLVDRHVHAKFRRLPGGFAAGEAAADDVNHSVQVTSGRATSQRGADLAPVLVGIFL